MAINAHTTPDWLATVLLAEDDTEESVPGGDLHQQAVREAHGALWDYAVPLDRTGQLIWYVSSQVTVIVPLPMRRRVWRAKPDVFVVPGVPAHSRDAYDIRRDGPMPTFVLEVVSESSWENDIDKATLYRLAGVQEYLIFDPTGEFLGEPRLRGWRMHEGVWQPWASLTRPDGAVVWESAVLGLAARADGVLVRYDHPQRGPLPIRAELWAALAAAREARAEREGRTQV